MVVDVRSQPYSRHVPHFNRETLARALREQGFTEGADGEILPPEHPPAGAKIVKRETTVSSAVQSMVKHKCPHCGHASDKKLEYCPGCGKEMPKGIIDSIKQLLNIE